MEIASRRHSFRDKKAPLYSCVPVRHDTVVKTFYKPTRAQRYTQVNLVVHIVAFAEQSEKRLIRRNLIIIGVTKVWRFMGPDGIR